MPPGVSGRTKSSGTPPVPPLSMKSSRTWRYTARVDSTTSAEATDPNADPMSRSRGRRGSGGGAVARGLTATALVMTWPSSGWWAS